MKIMVDPQSRKQKNRKKNRIGLSRHDEAKIRNRLRATFPSEAWIDACFLTIEDVDQNGDPIIYRFDNLAAFPPGGKATAMVVCPLCRRTVPPNHLEHFSAGERLCGYPGFVGRDSMLCADHKSSRLQSAWGASPSASAIRQLQLLNLRLLETKTQPEGKAALKREVKIYHKTGKLQD